MHTADKRDIELVVISDIHLGTYGCRAKELLNYLKSIRPKTLILNGDIIDIWQFSKRYFPKSHMELVLYLTSLLTKGTRIFYITGNHDEVLRKFEGFELGQLKIVNKLVLELDGRKAWFFHGDVFDVTMKYSKWLAKLGGMGYDLLIMINTLVNWVSERFGKGRISLSKRVKNGVKGALKHINNFERTAAEIAIDNGYDYVVCGHIHQPQKRQIYVQNKSVTYLNSGDWIENLTALEYHRGEWKIYEYGKEDLEVCTIEEDVQTTMVLSKAGFKNKQLFLNLVAEFQFNFSKNN